MRISVKNLNKISITPENSSDSLLLKNFMEDVASGKYNLRILDVRNIEGDVTELSIQNDLIIPVTGVSLTPATLTLVKGTTSQLTTSVLPTLPTPPVGAPPPPVQTNRSVTYLSSNTAVITVDNAGLVTAVDGGTATVTVTTTEGGFTDVTTVTVTVNVSSVSIDETASVNVGETVQLNIQILPANATNKAVTYSSSDDTIATVSSTGLVTGVLAGTATITVTTTDGSFTDTSVITVT
jgi:uncharacterized protein YjdB